MHIWLLPTCLADANPSGSLNKFGRLDVAVRERIAKNAVEVAFYCSSI